MGLLMAIALETRGVSSIKFVDVDDTRLELAESFGFHGIASGSSELDQNRQGMDLVVDATGVPAVAGEITSFIANGGKGLFFGVCPAEAKIDIAPFEIFRRQLTLAGSHSLNHNIPAALQTIASYGPEIARVVSHQMCLDEIAAVLSAKPPKGSLKVQYIRS